MIVCNADIFFNKQCLDKQITPNYANFRIPTTSPAATKAQSKAQTIRLKEEIRFLYKKKDIINKGNTIIMVPCTNFITFYILVCIEL